MVWAISTVCRHRDSVILYCAGIYVSCEKCWRRAPLDVRSSHGEVFLWCMAGRLLGIAISACSWLPARRCAQRRVAGARVRTGDRRGAERSLYGCRGGGSYSLEQQKLILRMVKTHPTGENCCWRCGPCSACFPLARRRQTEPGEPGACDGTGQNDSAWHAGPVNRYAVVNPVDPDNAKPYVQRMFQLGNQTADVREWYRIKTVALHLKVDDLEQQAEARAEKLAGR